MPNSLAVEAVLTQAVVGTQQFDGLRGACVSMPDGLYNAVTDCVDLVRTVMDSDGDTGRPDVPDYITTLA
ncbi:hypothetical protein [Streptomyces sp. MN6]